MSDELCNILRRIKEFRDERDWMQFHDPKSMASSVVIEAAELLEHFQWKRREEIDDYVKKHKEEIAEEVADVALYLFELADNLGIDVFKAMEKKLGKNAKKYPVEKAKGSALKYDKL